MKIALCLSGQPRGLPLSLEIVKDKLITPNNITDVFIHTWYDSSCDNQPFDSAQPHQEDGRLGVWKPNTHKILKQELNPKSLLCESPNPFTEFSHLPGPRSAVQTKLASLFYGMWKANELKKTYEKQNNFKYDLVIRTRIDLFYPEPIILNPELQENEIIVPHSFQHHRMNDSYPLTTGGDYSSMVDIFAYGSSTNMDKFCSVYPEYEKIHGLISPNTYGEAYLGYQVRKKHNISLKLEDIKLDILHRVVNLSTIN